MPPEAEPTFGTQSVAWPFGGVGWERTVPAYWKGYLKLMLINCPVSLTPAITEKEKIRFHTINRQTGRRVESQYVDAGTGKPVKEKDEVKGYQTADDKFVLIEDDEIADLALESTRTIDVDTFVEADSIPWLWYDAPYYLTPSDKVGEEAFAVIRDAMAQEDVVGISRLVLGRRERAVLLQPRGKGIVLWTLRYGDEVRDPDEYFKDIGGAKPDAKTVNLVKQLIEERSKPWSSDMAHDPVQDKLAEIIEAKKARKKPPKASAPRRPEGDNVIDLMAALKRSLETAGSRKPRR